MEYAFFDLDGTVISPKSLLSFYEYYLAAHSAGNGGKEWALIASEIEHKLAEGWTRANLNRWFYEVHFAGLSVATVQRIATEWLVLNSSRENFYIDKTLERIRAHQNSGQVCVLVTGSFREVADPIGKSLGFIECLCAPLEEVDGIYTGKLLRLPTIGLGKKLAIQSYCESNLSALDRSFGYGDDISDLPFLETVGHPNVISGNCPQLVDIAAQRSWSVM